MGVRRVVPDLASVSLEVAISFYGNVLGLQPVMDHGWIVTLADPERPGVQVSLMTRDATAPVIPDASIQVDDVDSCYAAAVRAGAEIVHPLTDEPWGVRRFFVRDPDGHVLNLKRLPYDTALHGVPPLQPGDADLDLHHRDDADQQIAVALSLRPGRAHSSRLARRVCGARS